MKGMKRPQVQLLNLMIVTFYVKVGTHCVQHIRRMYKQLTETLYTFKYSKN